MHLKVEKKIMDVLLSSILVTQYIIHLVVAVIKKSKINRRKNKPLYVMKNVTMIVVSLFFENEFF